MNGKICQNCKYNDEKGICRLSPEQMEALLTHGYCSDIACTAYECREDETCGQGCLCQDETVKNLKMMTAQEDPKAVFDRQDEQRQRSRERED
jgi:hypothetical protein